MAEPTGQSGADPFRFTSSVREGNVTAIIGLLRERGPLSRAEIVRASGLARPTVMAIISSLLDSGVAVESGRRPAVDLPRAGAGGRPGTLIGLNRAARTAIAARLALGRLHLTHVTSDGAVLAQVSVPAPRQPRSVLTAIVREAKRLVGSAGTLGSLSLTVAGFIDDREGTVHYPPQGWHHIRVRSILESALEVPVNVISPASAAVLGEIAGGGATDHGDVVLLFVAQGIGTAVVSGGRLLRGAGAAVGELGHCPVGGRAVCRCGKVGCLETVAAGWAIRDRASAIRGTDLSTASLAELEQITDPAIRLLLRNAARALGSAAAWMVNLLSPSMVVLARTSYVDGADRFFSEFVRAARAAAVDLSGNVPFELGTDGAVVLGSIQGALELLPGPIRPKLHLRA